MKLAAIYNVWDNEELLEKSMKLIESDVELIIIIWQATSNYGENYMPIIGECPFNELDGPHTYVFYDNNENKLVPLKSVKIIFKQYLPNLTKGGAVNETEKRNVGLEIAKKENCTHFLFMDCDEMYEDFGKAKQLYIDSGANGTVCRMFTYWGKPTYQLDPIEDYWVPFIHQLRENTAAGMQDYPFYCDPTRRVNEQNVVELPVMLHHFSWVRQNIERKVRNSSAKNNLEKSTYLQDYYDLIKNPSPEGHFLPGIGRKIKIVPNYFNISI